MFDMVNDIPIKCIVFSQIGLSFRDEVGLQVESVPLHLCLLVVSRILGLNIWHRPPKP